MAGFDALSTGDLQGMRVGLVLGGGGLVGASWLIGALEALESETGWSAADAELIVGTSAGSVIGAMTAQGIPPAFMGAYSSGEALDDLAETEGRGDALAERFSGLIESAADVAARATGAEFRLHRGLPTIGPGSWRMATGTLLHPTRHAPTALMGGWLPRGFISTQPISELVETFVGDWPDHPGFRAVAADYRSGRRVVFGEPGAPRATAGQAVAASCAIPAFYHPVKIGSSRYVDGGICSPSNLDLVRDRDLDLVVCLNPTSSLASVPIRTPGDAVGALMRRESGKRLGHEARKVREGGTDVLLLQPTRRDLVAMGPNLMSRARRVAVAETAVRTTAVELRRLRGTDARLPGGKRRASV
ncbi:MAG: patatin-like phospholipase family protein, partial [Solirubrobacterales bacterium]|nr:patatin-like phospholipase family protein [Solirubrobacterales bacterium]